MYLRTVRRRNKDGSEVSYVQLAHNVWDPVGRRSITKVIHNFGREDRLDRDALARLARSITRFLDPGQALEAQAPEGTRFLRSVPMGGAWLLDHLWRRLGVAAGIVRVARGRRVSAAVERLIFGLVANRALDPMSKLAALEWAAQDTWLPGIGELGEDPQIFYRAMDFLLECDEQIQREVFFAVSDLLNLQVDLILFDTTSTYFEIPAEREDELRKFGASKDHRPDLPQVVVGFAVTKEGIPVRCFTYPGNASDQEIIREVKDKLREWRLHRVIWVLDTGFNSEENRSYLQRAGGHYIIGEKLRQGTANRQALARQGRYRIVKEGLHVKQVWVGEGETRRRFVVCRNLEEARRDKHHREKWLQRIGEELDQVAGKQGEERTQAEARLITHPSMKRFITRRHGRLYIDRRKVHDDERLDGKFLISSSDDDLTADEIAIYYKQLIEVEACWRDQKHILDLRPIYHRKEDRIRAHVLLSFLALLLCRVAETRAQDTWPSLRRELERIHLGYFQGSAGLILQRTELTHHQREILAAVEIPEPPVFLAIEPTNSAYS
ncbi:MAG: IS1634 family transposase [Solirubrobacteraceae bacterium]